MSNPIEIKDKYITINIDTQELNLDKTLNCGQAFRWNKDKNNNWIGVIGNKIWILKQHNNYIETNICEEDKEILINYFNLDMNYNKEIEKLNLDDFALKAYEIGKGIHILRQDLFETMVTFLMSSCNTMQNIRNILNKLCKAYGNQLKTNWKDESFVAYEFPTLKQLSNISEDEFRQLNMGFRAKYLVEMIKELNKDTTLLSKIYQSTYRDSINILIYFPGIGKKVANCISLFALHHIEAFPIDVHIKK